MKTLSYINNLMFEYFENISGEKYFQNLLINFVSVRCFISKLLEQSVKYFNESFANSPLIF